jgi:putative inorganic carbon (hco3(-)) transporter
LIALAAVVDLARDRRSGSLILGALLVAGAAEAAFGGLQFATGSGPAGFALGGALRAYGHFEQPNPFAGYLTTILPVAAALMLCPSVPQRLRQLAFGAAAVIAGGILLSQSRGAWLGALVAGSFLLLIWSARTRRLLVPGFAVAASVLVLALVGLLPAAILDRLGQTVEYFGIFDVRTVERTSQNWAVVERMAHWQAGWAMFVDFPWLGVGAGNYAEAYPDYYVDNWGDPLGHAHNYYLNMLAELGVLGLAMLLLILGVAFGQFLRSMGPIRYGERLFWRALLAGVLGSLAVFCVHNMFDNLFVHSVNLQIGVLLGVGLVAVDHLRRPSRVGVVDARAH